MAFTCEQYLQEYSKLSNPQFSKEANMALLELENSDQAWAIAEKLITHSNHHVHGCQLLSKKLNSPLPAAIKPEAILQFIFSFGQLNNILWLCTAKLLIHMNLPPSQITINISQKAKIQILKEIPSAILQIRTSNILDAQQLKRAYFETNKKLLIEHFFEETQLVLECIENFVTNNVKIKSSVLLSQLLQLPISQTAIILEEIFLHEQYKEMTSQILLYLNNCIKNMQYQEDHEDIFPVYIAFCQTLNIFHLPISLISLIFHNIFQQIQGESEPKRTNFTDTYEFWVQVSQDHKGNRTANESITVLINESFVKLWGIICNKSLLKELPVHIIKHNSSFSIDVDSPDEEDTRMENGKVDEVNHLTTQNRTYALDFFTLCIQNLREQSPHYIQQLFKDLYQWSSGSMLQLQLVLFVLESIADIVTSEALYCSKILKIIMSREGEFNQYICQKVVVLMGKMQTILMADLNILSSILDFLSKALSYSRLAPLASESFCNLMEDFQTESNESYLQFESKVETFLDTMYNIFYKEIRQEKVLQNLTRSLVVFIYKFKQSPLHYQHFLDTFTLKISELPLIQTKAKYLECIIMGQIWLNSQNKQDFLPIFAQFLSNFSNILMENCSQAKRKPQFTEAVNLINIAIKSEAIKEISVWVKLINALLQKYFSYENPLPIVLTPLINLSKIVEPYSTSIEAIETVKLIAVWEHRITSLLSKYDSLESEYSLVNYIMQMHVAIVKLFYSNASHSQYYAYDPSQITSNIYNKIYNNKIFWEYEIFKNSLLYLHFLILLGYPADQIMDQVLKNYGKLSQTLWNQIQNIFFTVYKKYGMSLFLKSLSKVKPQLSGENPLVESLRSAFEKCESKTIKNILLCLP